MDSQRLALRDVPRWIGRKLRIPEKQRAHIIVYADKSDDQLNINAADGSHNL